MFRTTGSFDKLLEKATSNLLLEPDWVTTLQICDLIRQNDIQPKYAIAAIKKKLYSQNPHCAMYALQVLESMVKNCGSIVHNEVASKETCEMFRELAKTSPHENVRQKVLELIQGWAFAFRKKPKYRAVLDIVNILKAEGYKFPTLNESDAMFTADSAPEWSDGTCCHRCRSAFSLVQRKHHCRACGQVFCGQCSQHTATLPKFGIEKEVRVCDGCFTELNKPGGPLNSGTIVPLSSGKAAEAGDLPPEYVNSSLAQQSQSPPRKTEEELREEEELHLAIALSQSEAEEKEKEKKRITRNAGRSYSPSPVRGTTPTPKVAVQKDEEEDPELARYLNRSYWETKQDQSSPSAPTQQQQNQLKIVDGSPPLSPNKIDPEMNEFVGALKSQVEIFVNRMKSNSSRGRSIANDSSVQTLFMNITAMHSRLLRYIQQQDDDRLRYEALQDKLSQVKDARAALDALREEHAELMRREAEEAERQRQLQMAHKLEIMRKKKQEYLQYQRQLALQRIQEQEREMQMRQEQQKQQYLQMGGQMQQPGGPQQQPPYGYSPVHQPVQQHYQVPQMYPPQPPQQMGGYVGGLPGQPPSQMMPPPGILQQHLPPHQRMLGGIPPPMQMMPPTTPVQMPVQPLPTSPPAAAQPPPPTQQQQQPPNLEPSQGPQQGGGGSGGVAPGPPAESTHHNDTAELISFD